MHLQHFRHLRPVSEFVIIANMRGTTARYLFDDARKALKRAVALTNKGVPITITMGDGDPVTLEDLANAAETPPTT